MISSLVSLAIYILVIGVVIWLLLFLIDLVPLPEPFGRIARIVIIAIGVLIVIFALLQVAGMGGAMPRLH